MPQHLNDQYGRTGNILSSTAAPTGGVWLYFPSGMVSQDMTLDGAKVTLPATDPAFVYNNAIAAGPVESATGEFTPAQDNWTYSLMLRLNPATGTGYQLLVYPGGSAYIVRRDSTSAGYNGSSTLTPAASNQAIAAANRASHTFALAISPSGVLTASIDGVALNFGGTITDTTHTAAGYTGFGGRGGTSTDTTGDGSASGSTPVSFSGTVPTINATVGTAGSVDLASYFSGTLTPFTYTTFAGTLPTGFSRSGSVISWTTGTTAATTTGIQVRATDTGSNVATTNAFSIVVAAAPSAPTINTHPSNQTVTTPATATFTVSASGTGLSYQWQRNPGGVGSFANISGATGTSYTTGATAVTGGSHNNGDTYRVVVTNGGGSLNSNAATLTVNAPSSTGTLTLTAPLCNNTGEISGKWISQTGITLTVISETTKASVLVVTGRATDAAGVLTAAITDAAITTGQTYRVVPSFGGNAGITQVLIAT